MGSHAKVRLYIHMPSVGKIFLFKTPGNQRLIMRFERLNRYRILLQMYYILEKSFHFM